MASYDIAKEMKKWEERVIFPGGFKPNTKANIERLDQIQQLALEHFVTIAANSESLCYKIGKHFISKGNTSNSQIAFLNGSIIQSYIGDSSAEWKKKERVDEFFKIFGEGLKNKWVIIPTMDFEIEIGLAIYFLTQFKKTSAIGLICYAEGSSNLVEVLSLDSGDENFFEYPNKKYRRNKRKVEDDEY